MASLLYATATGEAVSIGTVIADPLPDGLSVFPLSGADWANLRDGTARWDPATLAVVAVPPDVTVTVTASLLAKANAALTANANYLAISSPNNAQVRDHVAIMVRELNGIIRLLTGEVFGQRTNLETEPNT